MVDQRRGGGFTVRPCDANHPRRGFKIIPSAGGKAAEKQADVIVDRHACVKRAGNQLVRRGVKMRNAGRGDQKRHLGKGPGTGQIMADKALGLGPRPRLGAIVPNQRLGAPRHKRPRGRQTRAAKAKNSNFAASIASDGNHRSAFQRDQWQNAPNPPQAAMGRRLGCGGFSAPSAWQGRSWQGSG